MSDKLQNYPCSNCGAMISPPEILSAMIKSGSVNVGKFETRIYYPCPNCKAERQTDYTGKISIDTIEVYSVRSQ